jgi:hypothetical protein
MTPGRPVGSAISPSAAVRLALAGALVASAADVGLAHVIFFASRLTGERSGPAPAG